MSKSITEIDKVKDVVQTAQLEESKKSEIVASLHDVFSRANEWAIAASAIQVTDISQSTEMKKARELRLVIQKARTSAAKVVDSKRAEVQKAMANYTTEDKLWLKVKQMIEIALKGLESGLEEKEKFAELYAKREEARLRDLRTNLIKDYREYMPSYIDLGKMNEKDFEALMATCMQKAEEAA